MSNLPKVSVSELLDAGIHFGHKTSRWNPKMAPYIYGTRDGVHIIDLQQTVPLMQIALKKIYETVKKHNKCLVITEEPYNNSFAQALAGRIQQTCFQYLDAPVRTLGAENIPAVPLNETLEKTMMPSTEKVGKAIKQLLDY